MVDRAIIHILKHFKADKDTFEEYLKAVQNTADLRDKEIKEERSKLQLQYNALESEKKKYITENARMATI